MFVKSYGFNDSNDFDERDNRPLPEGIYNVAIDKVTREKTRNGNGTYLGFTFRIFGERYNNKCLFQNILTEHSSLVAMRIAATKLKTIIDASKDSEIKMIVTYLEEPKEGEDKLIKRIDVDKAEFLVGVKLGCHVLIKEDMYNGNLTQKNEISYFIKDVQNGINVTPASQGGFGGFSENNAPVANKAKSDLNPPDFVDDQDIPF